MFKYIALFTILFICVSGHAVLRTPTPWSTSPSTASPCGGGTAPTTGPTFNAGSKQTVVWQVIAGDGAGPVTGLVDPAGGTNFVVAVLGLQAEASPAVGTQTFTMTVPSVKCTGPGGLCTMQVKSSSNWQSCTSFAIAAPSNANELANGGKGVASGQALIGNETPVSGHLISTNFIVAAIMVPGIIMAPLIGLYVASVMDKTAPLGEKVDSLGGRIRVFFEQQALDQAGHFIAQMMRVLSFAGLFGVLAIIWSAVAAAYLAGPVSGVGMTAAVLIAVTTGLGLYAAYKRDLRMLLGFIAASVITAVIQIVFLALSFAFFASISKLATATQQALTPVTAIVAVMVIVHLILLPLNLVANTMARRARSSLVVGGYQPTLDEN
jgi:hypothetical protein